MKKTMEKSYQISSIILAIMALIIFSIILFIGGNESLRFIPCIFAAIVFGLSFPSSVISRHLINIGNKLESTLLKILFYVIVLPIVSFFILCIGFVIIRLIYPFISLSKNFGTALLQFFILLFLVTIAFIAVILPYIQTVIVLILNRFVKN